MPDTKDASAVQQRPSFWRSTGPAIIVASVVLGPGSILTSSKVGWYYGFAMLWVVIASGILLFGMTALSARLGVLLPGTICDELAARVGRPLAVITGGTLFLIAACFQFGNNLGVLFALEPFFEPTAEEASRPLWPVFVLVLINLLVIVALFGFRELYKPVETAMKALVALMMVAFTINFVWSAYGFFNGELRFPSGVIPPKQGEPSLAVIGLFATTFSVGGAFYQSYLVRQKGWTQQHLRQGVWDSMFGISVLCLVTMMIMSTAAIVLYPNPEVQSLSNAGDVARQLGPLFGSAATAIFCMGIFAGAFSSFLVNAMIGGSVLADGLGLGRSMNDLSTKLFTVVGLLAGMGIAIAIKLRDFDTGNLIVFAQALTVIGNPLLAGTLLYLATRPDMVDERRVPKAFKVLALIGLLVAATLSVRTAINIAKKLAPKPQESQAPLEPTKEPE